MTVAELVAELMSIEDQSLPVFWTGGEEGAVCPGGLYEQEIELTGNQPGTPYHLRRKEKRRVVEVLCGKTLEEFCDV